MSYPGHGGAYGYPYGDQQWQRPHSGGPADEPRATRGKVLVISLVVALLLAVGGGLSVFALVQGGSAGSDTPTAAATKLVSSFGNGDVVGVLDSLAPAEAALLIDLADDYTSELKRIGVLEDSADPREFGGLELEVSDLRFDDAQAESINDHLTITKLTGGTITMSSDFAAIPLADDIKNTLIPPRQLAELERQGQQTETIDIAEEVRRTGDPIRIATINVDGGWYPSLFYTVADNMLAEDGQRWPEHSIDARGANSPNAALTDLVTAGANRDIRRVIELLPPGEMSVMHDLGPLLVEMIGQGPAGPAPFELIRLDTEESEASGGTRLTMTALELAIPGHGRFSLVRDGTCYRMEAKGHTERMCADDAARMIASQVGPIPPEVVQSLRTITESVLNQGLGVVTTEVDGKHYVSPLRTYSEIAMTVLRSIRPDDVQRLLRLAN